MDAPKKTKSRSGCQRCKLKRLKCDESKPHCNQCLSRNISCPGYKKLLKWSTKYEVFNQPHHNSNHGLTAPTNASPIADRRDSGLSEDDRGPRDLDEHRRTGDRPLTEGGQVTLVTTRSSLDAEAEKTPPPFSPINASDSRLSRFLLHTFYRLPSTIPSQKIHDGNSLLVEHYFRDVCGLYSSFDSYLNPYRASIARIWQDSPSIYYAIQSMAAAQLANAFPEMSVTGIEMQQRAYSSLKQDLELVSAGKVKSERVFLAMLLLGLTACWHDSRDLGLSHLKAARSLMLPKLLAPSLEAADSDTQRQSQFFEESLIYWEMLVGFVSSESISSAATEMVRPPLQQLGRRDIQTPRNAAGRSILPHPWTGVAPEMHMLFAEVGRLVRHQRTRRLLHYSVEDCLSQEANDLEIAKSVEEDLLSAQLPSLGELAETGDPRTSKSDFLLVAEAYRCVGLLELYRVFPRLLQTRLGKDELSWAKELNFDSFIAPPCDASSKNRSHGLFVLSLALHVISLLESIPGASGTCFVQLLLFTATASELRYLSSLDYFDIYANDARVFEARRFVESRLREFALRLPAKPINKMLDLIKEVWKRADVASPEEDIFWVDVMIEKGWETIMG